MVHADPADQEPPKRPAERRIEPEPADQLLDLLLLVLGQRIETEVPLRRLGGLALGEVDQVDRCLAVGEQFLDRVVQRRRAVLEVERHGPLCRTHERRVASGPLGQLGLEERRRTERRRHQQELAVRQLEHRQLPRPSALRVGVEVELVGDHDVDVGCGAVAERPVRQDLGGAADDRRVGIDAAVAGDHADQVGPERGAQLEELLRHERLDRRRVDAALGRRPRPTKCAATATSDLPEPVGVFRITLLPAIKSSSASSWAGYISIPCVGRVGREPVEQRTLVGGGRQTPEDRWQVGGGHVGACSLPPERPPLPTVPGGSADRSLRSS